jgi:hypothetical protein
MVKKRKKVRSDTCDPLRQQIERVEEEINEIDEALGEPDIPADIRRRLQALKRQRQQLLNRLRQDLKKCEALSDHRSLIK